VFYFILFYFISLRFDAFHWNLFIYLLEGGRVLSTLTQSVA